MKNFKFNTTKKVFGLGSVLVIMLFAAGCSLYGSSQTSSSAPTTPATGAVQPTAGANSVNIQNFAFGPVALTIKAGQTVTWTNNDSAPHQIKSTTFNSGVLANGQTYSFTFAFAGTFDYICAIHPSMAGKIIVQ